MNEVKRNIIRGKVPLHGVCLIPAEDEEQTTYPI